MYLEHYDAVITGDQGQCQALRVLNVLSRRRPRARVLFMIASGLTGFLRPRKRLHRRRDRPPRRHSNVLLGYPIHYGDVTDASLVTVLATPEVLTALTT